MHRNTQFSWFVSNKQAGTIPPKGDNSAPIRFDRVRIIKLMQKYLFLFIWVSLVFLLPCRPMYAVLKDINYYDLPCFVSGRINHSITMMLMHLSTKIVPQTNEVLNKMLNETRSTHHYESGRYNGVPLRISLFILELPEFMHELITIDLN